MNSLKETTLKIILQGGAVSIALAILYVLYKVLTNDFIHVEAVIEKNNTAILRQFLSNEKVANSIDKLGQIIEKKIK